MGLEPQGLMDKGKEPQRFPAYYLLLIIAVVFTAEIAAMAILPFLALADPVIEALADALILVLIISPFLYKFVSQPLLEEVRLRLAAQEEQRKANHELHDLANNLADILKTKLGELQSAELRYTTMAENSGDIFITANAAMEVVSWNRAAVKAFGYAPPEMLGRDFTMIVPDQYKKRHAEAVSRFLASGRLMGPPAYETEGLRKDGAVFPLELSLSAYEVEAERFVTAIGRDITARKEAEYRLTRSKAELDERVQLSEFGAAVGVALTGAADLREILQQCAEAFISHLGAAFARIWTFNPKENMLEMQASAGMYTHIDGPHGRIPVSAATKVGTIACQRQAFLTNAVIGDPLISDQEWARREGMVAFAGHPLVIGDRLVGVMAMFARKPLNEVVIKALASFAHTIALGIERKSAEADLHRKMTDLERFYEMAVGRELKMKKLKKEIGRLKAAHALTDNAGVAGGDGI